MNGLNANAVLSNLEELLKENKAVPMRSVYDKLGIFDWWVDTLSVTRQKQMRSFLRLAIKLGYTGYVCFKVGATGCANGMWAYKNESEDGYSPKGEALYRSFTPEYVYYDACLADGSWLSKEGKWDDIHTVSQLKKKLAERQNA